MIEQSTVTCPKYAHQAVFSTLARWPGSVTHRGHLRNTNAVRDTALVVARGTAVAIWWKRLRLQGDLLDNEAAQFIQSHGDRATEVARKAARSARNKRDLRQARHFSHLALRIAELSKAKIGLDTATQAPAVDRHLSGAEDCTVIPSGTADAEKSPVVQTV